jgi:phage terminase large subunit-like protein
VVVDLKDIDVSKLTAKDIRQFNDWAGYLSYKETPIWDLFIRRDAKIIAFFTGNQFGKTSMIARSYVLRLAGRHPIAEDNFDFLVCNPEDVWRGHRFSLRWREDPHFIHGIIGENCPKCGKKLVLYFSPYRTVRCASENLPGQTDDEKGKSTEVRNTQYPELKKWLPPSLLKKDITARNPVMKVGDIHGGPQILFEFVSYNQATQAQAGVQRHSIWFDEQPPLSFYEEQRPRLLASGGKIFLGMTPALHMTWTFDDIFMRAHRYYRTKTIAEQLGVPEYEVTDSKASIVVFQAATDDNPTLYKRNIDEILGEIDDPDELMIRRYGVFKQVAGTIHKGFDLRIHPISGAKFFPEGVPKNWMHARGIDYHQRVKWAFNAMALSPQNELFVYLEADFDPTKLITYEIARQIAKLCGEYKYQIERIDPLAGQTQVNTGKSTIDDLNDFFRDFRKEEQLGTGAWWEPWDTKGIRGREDLQRRIANSKKVGKPFNNHVQGRYLPTVWIFDACHQTVKSLKQWRWEEWQSGSEHKEAKETPEQRYSHHCMTIECILKDESFRPRLVRSWDEINQSRIAHRKSYFQTAARA